MTKNGNEATVVGNGVKNEEEKAPKRIPFPIETAKAIIPIIKDGKPTGSTEFNACQKDGLLFAVPKTIIDGGKIIYDGWSLDKHKPIPKSQFADDATYLEFQAESANQKAEKFLSLAGERLEQAARIRKFGDKTLQKKAAKLEKMRKAIAEMEAEFVAEGIDINEV